MTVTQLLHRPLRTEAAVAREERSERRVVELARPRRDHRARSRSRRAAATARVRGGDSGRRDRLRAEWEAEERLARLEGIS